MKTYPQVEKTSSLGGEEYVVRFDDDIGWMQVSRTELARLGNAIDAHLMPSAPAISAVREKPMADAVVEFLRDLLPPDAETISASFCNYPSMPAGPHWSITGSRWPSDDTQRVTGATLNAVLVAWSKRPEEKAKRIADLEAQLAVLKGQAVEVAV